MKSLLQFLREADRMAVGGVLVLLLIFVGVIVEVNTKKVQAPAPAYVPEASAAAPAPVVAEKEGLFDAYGMACEFVRKQYASAESFRMLKDECIDNGNNEWIIVGTAKVENDYGNMSTKRWVAQIKYDGSQYWSLVYPIVVN